MMHWDIGPPCRRETWVPSSGHETWVPSSGHETWVPSSGHETWVPSLAPPSGNETWVSPLVTSSGHHYRSVQSCSLHLTVQLYRLPGNDTWWPLKE